MQTPISTAAIEGSARVDVRRPRARRAEEAEPDRVRPEVDAVGGLLAEADDEPRGEDREDKDAPDEVVVLDPVKGRRSMMMSRIRPRRRPW